MEGTEEVVGVSKWTKAQVILVAIGLFVSLIACAVSLANFFNYSPSELKEDINSLIESVEADSNDSTEVWISDGAFERESHVESPSTTTDLPLEIQKDVRSLLERAEEMNLSGRYWFSEMKREQSSVTRDLDYYVQIRSDLVKTKRLDSLLAAEQTHIRGYINTGRLTLHEEERLLGELERASKLNQGTISDLSMTIEAWPVPVGTGATPSIPHDLTRPEKISQPTRADSSTTYDWQLPPIYEPPFLDPKENGYEWSKHILPPLNEE